MTTDRLILTPENEHAHSFQIVSTNEELRFQRFIATGRPPMDANMRFVGDRHDPASVETFMVLSDPFSSNSSMHATQPQPSVPQQTVRITKPITALDDLSVRGLLTAHSGVAFLGGNALIDATGKVIGVPEVHVEGGIWADGNLHIGNGVLHIGNISLQDDSTNASLRILANVHMSGNEFFIGPMNHMTGMRTHPAQRSMALLANGNERIAMQENRVTIACGPESIGHGNEIRYESSASGNAQLVFYDAGLADQSLVTLEASKSGLVIAVHGDTNTSVSYFSSFTGAHICVPESTSMFDMSLVGQIVESTGEHSNVAGRPLNPTEAVPVVRIATEGSKAVFGVIGHVEEADTTSRTMIAGSLSVVGNRDALDRRLVVVSVGEGAMWVISENGPIENGDFIEVSSVPGYGRRSPSDMMTNRIVAKATGSCAFDASLDTTVVYERTFNDGSLVVDSMGVPVLVPKLDASGQVVKVPRYATKRVGNWYASYIPVTVHCG